MKGDTLYLVGKRILRKLDSQAGSSTKREEDRAFWTHLLAYADHCRDELGIPIPQEPESPKPK